MVKHVCEICLKEFKQKIHLANHKQRKNPCKKAEVQQNVIETVKKTRSRIMKSAKEMKALSWFSEHFPELYVCITKDLHKKIQEGHKFIIFQAQVKTGKRFAVEIYALYTTPLDPTNVTPGEKIVHIFISSWVRRADDNQRHELNTYLRGTDRDPRVFKINSEKSRMRCINKLKELVKEFDIVIVHLDELDYGSGADQHMAGVFDYCQSHAKIRLICYSASPEEALVERLTSGPYAIPVRVVYTPPPNYRGAEWYCEQGLVCEAKPFFDISDAGEASVSQSARELLERTKQRVMSNNPNENRRKLLIVRQNIEFGTIHDLIEKDYFPEFGGTDDIRIITKFVHSKTDYSSIQVKWDIYHWWKKTLEVEYTGKYILILFIDQSSSRSTDWFCHPWLSAYHDYHPEGTPINTSLQSNLRTVYYTNKFCDGKQVYNNEDFFPELHGQKDVIEYAAGLIPITDVKRNVSTRAKVFEQLPTFGPVITVKLNDDEIQRYSVMLEERLNENTRPLLKALILSKLKGEPKKLLQARELKGKRRYHRIDVGGIDYVARNVLRKLNSRPGGGGQDEEYDNRQNYFWIDIAMIDLEFECEKQTVEIPKGTIYITHGIADPDIDDDKSISSQDSDNPIYQHRVKKESMFNK